MTGEEMERALEFLVKSQAQSESRINRLERVVGLAVRAGLRARRDTREKLDALISAQLHTDDAMARLADSQTRTDGRVERLAGTVERFIEGQGGPA